MLAMNTQVTPAIADSAVGQVGDMVMFTTRSSGQPFVGKANGGTAQSYVAEVAWFIRGHTLHRRVLLVLPAPSPMPWRKASTQTTQTITETTLGACEPRNYTCDGHRKYACRFDTS